MLKMFSNYRNLFYSIFTSQQSLIIKQLEHNFASVVYI